MKQYNLLDYILMYRQGTKTLFSVRVLYIIDRKGFRTTSRQLALLGSRHRISTQYDPTKQKSNISRQTHNVPTTSQQHRCNVVVLYRRCCDVVCLLGIAFHRHWFGKRVVSPDHTVWKHMLFRRQSLLWTWSIYPATHTTLQQRLYNVAATSRQTCQFRLKKTQKNKTVIRPCRWAEPYDPPPNLISCGRLIFDRWSRAQQTHNIGKNVESTLILRLDVDSTLNRRCFHFVCPPGVDHDYSIFADGKFYSFKVF